MLMTHLLSAVFNGIGMLSLCHIHFRQELINLISYIKRGGYRAMSECSKYQLLLQTDYIRLTEKYEHLYIYSYILSYIRSDGCCKTIAACETVIFTVKCETRLWVLKLLNVRIDFYS